MHDRENSVLSAMLLITLNSDGLISAEQISVFDVEIIITSESYGF